MRRFLLPLTAAALCLAASPVLAQSPMSLQPLANSNPDNAKDTRSKKARQADAAHAKATADAQKKAKQDARAKAAPPQPHNP